MACTLQVLALLTAVACAADTSAPVTGAVARVSVTTPPDSFQVGDTARLVAVGIDAQGRRVPNTTVHWATSDDRIVGVSVIDDSSAIIVALATDSATVTASIGPVSQHVAVRVRNHITRSDSIELTPSAPVLAVGSSVQVNARVTDAQGSIVPDAVVTWVSQDSTVFTVSPTGLVTGRAPGIAGLVASTRGTTAFMVVSVGAPPEGTWLTAPFYMADGKSVVLFERLYEHCSLTSYLALTYTSTGDGIQASTPGATANCSFLSRVAPPKLVFGAQTVPVTVTDGVRIDLTLQSTDSLHPVLLRLSGTTAGGPVTLSVPGAVLQRTSVTVMTGQWRAEKAVRMPSRRFVLDTLGGTMERCAAANAFNISLMRAGAAALGRLDSLRLSCRALNETRGFVYAAQDIIVEMPDSAITFTFTGARPLYFSGTTAHAVWQGPVRMGDGSTAPWGRWTSAP